MNDFLYISDVVSLNLSEDTCNGCGMCVIVCPHDVFHISGRKAFIARKDYCMECGACALNCRPGAITVTSGVGCAAGILNGILNNSEPVCGCSDSNSACC